MLGRGGRAERAALREQHLRAQARSWVRSGLLGYDELLAELTSAIAADLGESGDAARLRAEAWVREETAALLRDEAGWPATTDYDRLQQVFADLEKAGVVVLQGCADHWSAKAELDRRGREGRRPRGVAWFTPLDVWHAIDDGMLEVNVWHGSTANIAPGDDLLRIVVAAFAGQGLEAHYDEGRIEVAASWRRRLSSMRGGSAGSLRGESAGSTRGPAGSTRGGSADSTGGGGAGSTRGGPADSAGLKAGASPREAADERDGN